MAATIPLYNKAVRLPQRRESWNAVKTALTAVVAAPWSVDVSCDGTARSALHWLFIALSAAHQQQQQQQQSEPRCTALAQYLSEMSANEASALLRGIAALALSLEQDFPSGTLPVLAQQQPMSLRLTRHGAACLLSCALLSLFADAEDLFSFSLDFHVASPGVMPILRGIMHYLRRAMDQPTLSGNVNWTRMVLKKPDLPRFETMADVPLTDLVIMPLDARIEDAAGMLQADFANCHLGGGVLHGGNAQEEVRFGLVSPELIVGMLFCETMEPNEAIVAEGILNYGTYTGYGRTMEFAGAAPADVEATVVAIDALMFPMDAQYQPELVMREAIKAFAGFGFRSTPEDRRAVATGKWGGGVFGGDNELKALIQWVACSAAQRPMHYFAFGDQRIADAISSAIAACKKHNISTVAQLWAAIATFCTAALNGSASFAEVLDNPPAPAPAPPKPSQHRQQQRQQGDQQCVLF